MGDKGKEKNIYSILFVHSVLIQISDFIQGQGRASTLSLNKITVEESLSNIMQGDSKNMHVPHRQRPKNLGLHQASALSSRSTPSSLETSLVQRVEWYGSGSEVNQLIHIEVRRACIHDLCSLIYHFHPFYYVVCRFCLSFLEYL